MMASAFEYWFSFHGRRGRASFMVANLALLIVGLLIYLILGWFDPSGGHGGLILLIFLLAIALCTYVLSAQRLRDFGLTGWLTLLWIPVNASDQYLHGAASLAFLIVLCVVPGTTGANRYGDDPLPIGGFAP